MTFNCHWMRGEKGGSLLVRSYRAWTQPLRKPSLESPPDEPLKVIELREGTLPEILKLRQFCMGPYGFSDNRDPRYIGLYNQHLELYQKQSDSL